MGERPIGRPHVLVLCDYFPPATKAGGPARSIFAIADVERARSDLEIVTRDRDLGDSQPYPTDRLTGVGATLPAVPVRRLPSRGQIRLIGRTLRRTLDQVDLVYLNSLVSPLYTIWPLILLRLGLIPRRPILLAPRGELAPGALAIKATKKRLALPVLRRILARLDVTWHASSSREAADIATFLGPLTQRVIIRANPAPPPDPGPVTDPQNNPFTVAFVGRMVPIKNFLLLARAIAQVSFPVRVVVAGAIEDQSYWRSCRDVLDGVPGSACIEVRGHIDDTEVSDLLRRSDVMVLPTRGENFGRAIAESLAIGCPVMIPDTTLWTPLLLDGAGRLINPDEPRMLADALTAYAAQTAPERIIGRERVRRIYRNWWKSTQQQPDSLFDEALGRVVAGDA